MRVAFSPEAKLEFEDGERYYAQQVPGLGVEFRADVRAALVRLRNWPLAAPVESGEIRRLVLSRFPYKLLYSVEADHLFVIALAHLHRAPNNRSAATTHERVALDGSRVVRCCYGNSRLTFSLSNRTSSGSM